MRPECGAKTPPLPPLEEGYSASRSSLSQHPDFDSGLILLGQLVTARAQEGHEGKTVLGVINLTDFPRQ